MDLRSVLRSALTHSANAESQLDGALRENYGPFVIALCGELADEGCPNEIRQLAGLYLKNVISAQDETIQDSKTERWLSCPTDQRNEIKNRMAQALMSASPIASRTAAQVVAAYGAVDVPRGEWPGLLPALLHNVTSGQCSLVTQVASLEALGYMCDQMDPDDVETSLVDCMLTTIVDGMREDRPVEVKRAAVMAMTNSLEFSSKNFEVEVERNAVMQCVCSAAVCPDLKVRINAFDCLAKIASLYYSTLAAYMDALFQLTANAIKNDDSQVGVLAVEFWSAICDEEIELLDILEEQGSVEGMVFLRIIQQAYAVLIPLLLEGMLKGSTDESEDESWNISMACATCLTNVAISVGDKVVDLVVPYVAQCISNPKWNVRDAGVIAFGCIMEGPSEEKLTPIVASALHIIIGCMSDPSFRVRESAAWTIGRLCESHSKALTHEIIPVLVKSLALGLDDNHASVAAKSCYAISIFAHACSDDADANSNALSSFLPHMLQKLFVVSDREDREEHNLRVSAYEACTGLVENSAADMKSTIMQLMAECLNRLEITFTQPLDITERSSLQCLLCPLITECVKKLTTEEAMIVSDRIVGLVLQIFQAKNAVAHEDAFVLLGNLADNLGESFIRYIDHVQAVLLAGLRNIEEHTVCIAAVGIIGDLCRALKKSLLPYCDAIMQALLELLRSDKLHRSVKPPVLACFADIAMAIEGGFERYIMPVLMVLQHAGDVSIQTNDEDLIEYINTLRESILDAYTGILQGLKGDEKQQQVVPGMQKLFEFIERCCLDTNRTVDVTKNLIGLIGDLGDCFGGRITNQLMGQTCVVALIQEGLADEDLRKTAQWTQGIMNEIRRNTR